MLAAILYLLVSEVAGVRVVRERGDSKVDEVVTYGAPKVGIGQLADPGSRGGCFSGVRVQNIQGWSSDAVPLLPPGGGYSHPAMRMMTISPGSSKTYSCGKETGFKVPSVKRHSKEEYIALTKDISEISDVTLNGLAISYESNTSKVKTLLESPWGLIASDVSGGDVCHLVQNADRECIITFSGSDDASDWGNNLDLEATDFCNLNVQVHRGFSSELMTIVTSENYLANIKPKLSSCSKVTATGHSLGGSIAVLFAACANNAAAASDNAAFQALIW